MSKRGFRRDRISRYIFTWATGSVHCGGSGGIEDLEDAYGQVVDAEPLRRRLREADAGSVADALARGVGSEDEAARLRRAAKAVAKVVAVDDFAPEELSPLARRKQHASTDEGTLTS